MATLKTLKASTKTSFSEEERTKLKELKNRLFTPRWTYRVDGRFYITYGWLPHALPEHDGKDIVFTLDGYWKPNGEIVCECGECFRSPIIDELYARPNGKAKS